ncbi:MAG: TldD/PmbA family protein [Candidatus Micrarchaeia archaeon]
MKNEIEKEIESLIQKTNKVMKELKREGADDVVLHAGIGNYQQTKFVNNKIVKNDSSISKSLYLFCNWKGKIIETTIKDTSEKGIKRTLNNIKRYTRYMPANERFLGIAQGPFRYKKEKYDKKIENAYEIHADVLESAINSAIENGSERNSGVFETTFSSDYLLTSGKCEAEGKDSSVYLSFRALCDKESSGHKVYSGRTTKNLDPTKIAKEAAQFAVQSKGEKKQIEGKMDVIFEPLPLAIILEHIGDATSAFEVETGNSFLVDKLGKRVGSEIFTLIDDPTYEDAYVYSTFDSEGVPTRTKKLIENGILKTYIHNTSTAKRHNTETTGNAGLINPHPWNIVLKKGNYSVEKLIENVDKGIYVTNAWYMRFQNYFTGEFSILPRDATFYIENGEIKHPIKNVRINSTLENIMQNTEMIGKNIEKIHSWEVHGSIITPSVLVKEIDITRPID